MQALRLGPRANQRVGLVLGCGVEVALIGKDEIGRGLVLHLDPDTLEQQGGTYTCSPDRRVVSGHFFICVSADEKQGRWLPVYSSEGVGRKTLSSSGRSGHPKWVDQTCSYHEDQVWTAPHDAVVLAAQDGHDMSKAGSRNHVADSEIPNV